MSDDIATYRGGAFLAWRSRQAATIPTPEPPSHFALPGALVPIARERLEAHQEDGLLEHEIVAYENRRHIEASAERLGAHARWVGRGYAASVQAHRELEMERRRKEADAARAYQERLAEILERMDGE